MVFSLGWDFARVGRLHSEVGTRNVSWATKPLTKNAPNFAPKPLSPYIMWIWKKSCKIATKFPSKTNQEKFTDELLQARREKFSGYFFRSPAMGGTWMLGWYFGLFWDLWNVCSVAGKWFLEPWDCLSKGWAREVCTKTPLCSWLFPYHCIQINYTKKSLRSSFEIARTKHYAKTFSRKHVQSHNSSRDGGFKTV